MESSSSTVPVSLAGTVGDGVGANEPPMSVDDGFLFEKQDTSPDWTVMMDWIVSCNPFPSNRCFGL